MLLTGFDAKYLNTLYVDKNLKHHGLIQAFSRTNRVLNATKPYGQILDFRSSRTASTPPSLSSLAPRPTGPARSGWSTRLPSSSTTSMQAIADLGEFMQSQGLEAKPDQVNNLMGDDARAQFINRFKEVQRLQTQLDQYTDLTDEQREQIERPSPRTTSAPSVASTSKPPSASKSSRSRPERTAIWPNPRSTSSTSSSSSLPPPSSTTTTSSS